MAWTAPRPWVAGELVTASLLNTHLQDNLLAIDLLLALETGTFTDGGVLLGNGTGVIQAMAVLAKGSLIVGDGVTDPAPLVVGADGTYLVADSVQALGVKWARPEILTNVADIMMYA